MIGYGLVIARVCLAVVFLYSGVDKLRHWSACIEEVRADGLPWPAAFAGATAFTQLVGGCLVATGFFAWFGALLLAGFTIAATLLVWITLAAIIALRRGDGLGKTLKAWARGDADRRVEHMPGEAPGWLACARILVPAAGDAAAAERFALARFVSEARDAGLGPAMTLLADSQMTA